MLNIIKIFNRQKFEGKTGIFKQVLTFNPLQKDPTERTRYRYNLVVSGEIVAVVDQRPVAMLTPSDVKKDDEEVLNYAKSLFLTIRDNEYWVVDHSTESNC
jgi:hypothetical protein